MGRVRWDKYLFYLTLGREEDCRRCAYLGQTFGHRPATNCDAKRGAALGARRTEFTGLYSKHSENKRS